MNTVNAATPATIDEMVSLMDHLDLDVAELVKKLLHKVRTMHNVQVELVSTIRDLQDHVKAQWELNAKQATEHRAAVGALEIALAASKASAAEVDSEATRLREAEARFAAERPSLASFEPERDRLPKPERKIDADLEAALTLDVDPVKEASQAASDLEAYEDDYREKRGHGVVPEDERQDPAPAEPAEEEQRAAFEADEDDLAIPAFLRRPLAHFDPATLPQGDNALRQNGEPEEPRKPSLRSRLQAGTAAAFADLSRGLTGSHVGARP